MKIRINKKFLSTLIKKNNIRQKIYNDNAKHSLLYFVHKIMTKINMSCNVKRFSNNWFEIKKDNKNEDKQIIIKK